MSDQTTNPLITTAEALQLAHDLARLVRQPHGVRLMSSLDPASGEVVFSAYTANSVAHGRTLAEAVRRVG